MILSIVSVEYIRKIFLVIDLFFGVKCAEGEWKLRTLY